MTDEAPLKTVDHSDDGWIPIPYVPGDPQPRIADGVYRGIRSDGRGGFEGIPRNSNAATGEQNVRDLVALVRKLAEQLHKAAPQNEWPDRAFSFLKRKGLQGSVLRDAAQETKICRTCGEPANSTSTRAQVCSAMPHGVQPLPERQASLLNDRSPYEAVRLAFEAAAKDPTAKMLREIMVQREKENPALRQRREEVSADWLRAQGWTVMPPNTDGVE